MRIPRHAHRSPEIGGEIEATARSLPEHEGKVALAAFGLKVPRGRVVDHRDCVATAQALGFPVVMKAVANNLEHKSDVGGVVVGVRSTAEADAAGRRLSRLSEQILVEEMVTDAVAEILIGVTVDRQFGQLLVLGAGGVLTELMNDSIVLLPPFTATAIEGALKQLTMATLLFGYRGRPHADIAAIVDAALACARYAEANIESLLELDINPLMVRPAGLGAIAVDALIRLA